MKLHDRLKRIRNRLVGTAIPPRLSRRPDHWARHQFNTIESSRLFEALETRRLLSVTNSASPPVLDAYAQNPLSFEPNVGQTAPQVQFLSRGPGYGLFLTPDEAVFSLQKSSAAGGPTAISPAPAVLTMQLLGANSAAGGAGLDPLTSTTNYLGASQATSLTDIPNYGQVDYQNVYSGINLIYYGNQHQLEFNFVVAPGADPNQIALRFQGADSTALDSAGDLVLHTAGGDVVEHAPVVYQTIGGARHLVEGQYVLLPADDAPLTPNPSPLTPQQVGFQLGAYDHSQPLVIDPVVVYSTYLGGSGNDYGAGIAVDSSGDSYVTGWTQSPDFPTTSTALQPTFNGGLTNESQPYEGETTFVTKFNPSGGIISSTYLGGYDQGSQTLVDNRGAAIAVDKAGNAYITGLAYIGDPPYTDYVPFPTTLTPFPSTVADRAAYGTFVAELNPALSQLVYSTYLPAQPFSDSSAFPEAQGVGIAVDGSGDAYVAGYVYGHGDNAFTAKLAPDGTVVFDEDLAGNAGSTSTLDETVNGPSEGNPENGIALDAAGNVYVVGTTDSDSYGSFPAPEVTPNFGGYSVYVRKLNPQGGQIYLAEVGGNDPTGHDYANNFGNAIAVDAQGDAYVTGATSSDNFPTVNPLQAKFLGNNNTPTSGDGRYNAFVFKLNPTGTQLLYSTYLGGSGNQYNGGYLSSDGITTTSGDSGNGIAVDKSGNAYVVGSTDSLDFPLVNPLQSAFGNGWQDAFVSELNANGSSLLYSTFYSGTGADQGAGGDPPYVFDVANGIALDSQGNADVTGDTTSGFFPTLNAAQAAFGGGVGGVSLVDSSQGLGSDAFVVQIQEGKLIVTPQPVRTAVGQDFSGPVATFTAPDASLPVSDYSASINWGDGSTSDGSISAAANPPSASPEVGKDASATPSALQVVGNHTYTTPGAFPVVVTVTAGAYGTASTESNVSQLPGSQSEENVAVDPVKPSDLFAVSVDEAGVNAAYKDATTGGLFAAYSTDGGATWELSNPTRHLIADGSDGMPPALGNPQAAFDQFGNLFLTYLGADQVHIVVLLSTNGGQTFSLLGTFSPSSSAPGSLAVNQPSIATGPGDQPGTGSVWISYKDVVDNVIDAAGTLVTGLGEVDPFNASPEVVPGSANGNFGSIAVGPSGQVLVNWQDRAGFDGSTNVDLGPDHILVSLDTDGLGSLGFGMPVIVTSTNVGGRRPLIPQFTRTVDAEANLAWDRSGGAHDGRVYLAYTDAVSPTVLDTYLELRYSDDNGATWSPPVRVDDTNGTSATLFLPDIAVDQTTGNVAVSWYDTRNDPNDTQTRFFTAVSGDGGKTFSPNVPVSVGTSDATYANLDGFAKADQYGDFTGLAFFGGMLYPAWADNSAALGSNPDVAQGSAFATAFDVAVGRFSVANVRAGPPVVTASTIGASEGSAFSGIVATFTDDIPTLMSGDFTATINWGDGSSSSGSTTPSGALDDHFIVRASHTYTMAGAYIVSITVSDDVHHVASTTETNVSQLRGNQIDGTIAVDPTGTSHLFAASSNESGGLFMALSADGGTYWAGTTIANGGADGLPKAGGQPQAAFDQFGNLYLAYVDQTGDNIVVAMSTDHGQSFTVLDTLFDAGGVSRPLIATGPGPSGSASVWLTFSQGTQIEFTCTDADSLGVVGAFNPVQVAASVADGDTLTMGGLAVGPMGQVLVSYQTQTVAAGPSTIYAVADANGLSGAFGPPVLVTQTNVGGSDPIPPQQTHTVSAGAGLAWDRGGGQNNGRVYLVYANAPSLGSQATKIFVRDSDDNGKSWSDPVQVSDDMGDNSEFMPGIAVNQTDADVGVAWYDARNDSNDVTTQFFAAASIDGGQSFSPNVSVGVGSSDATNGNLNAYGRQNQYGDYTGLAFAGGILYPVWADNTSELGGNPDVPQFDLAEARPAVAHIADLPLTAQPLDSSADVEDEGGEFTAHLATFSDPDPNAQAGNYTVTIDWGDPDPNTGAADTTPGTVTGNGGGMFTVSGTHVYQAASEYTITIKDKGGDSASVTTTTLIQDAPLSPGGDVALTAYVGQPSQAIVGTFTDTDPNGAPNNYATTIDWGDQQQSKGLVTFAGSAALTYDTANHTLYTFGNNDLVDNNPSYLMAIGLQGAVTPVAPVDGTFYGGLAFDPNDGALYALANAAGGVSTLMRFDFSAQTFSLMAVLGSGFTGGLAFNSADGNLYAIAGADGVSWALERIAPTNGAVTTLGVLAPAGNQPPLSYTGLSFYSDGSAYAVGNDSDGNSTLYRLSIGGSVAITSISQLGNNLTTPPSTQEGFTGGLAAVPVNVPGPGSLLAGSLVGISGDGSGTTYLNTIDVNGTATSVFEVYVAAPPGQTKPASGDFSNGFDIIGTHPYTQVMTAPLTITITDVEPSQVPDSVVRSTATDGGTVTVANPPPQALPAPPAFTAYQGYATSTLNLASFTVPGGPATASGVYSATIDWGDGSALDTGVVAVSGTTILCSGSHTYATQGGFDLTVVLDDNSGGSATATAAVNVLADLFPAGSLAPLTAFQGDATGTLSLASFSIGTGVPGAGTGAYTATIIWGDVSSTGTVQIAGLTVTVSGSHTYTRAGQFAPTVLLQDVTSGNSASVTDSLTVLADVTSQIHPVSSGPIYNPLTQLFNGTVTITNTGTTALTGPFPLVFQGLPAGVTLANATGNTGGGIPYVSDVLATLAPGESSTIAVQFKDPQFVPITYTLQVIDPAPSASANAQSGAGGLSVSADGRYVAFESDAGNLAPNPPPNLQAGGTNQVYVRDTLTGVITLVSDNATTNEGHEPAISPDGRYVAYNNGGLYLYDMTLGTTSLAASNATLYQVFSGNSGYLVFVSYDDFGVSQVYERDLQTGVTTLVSVNVAGTAGGINYSQEPSVSADGRFVAFQSDSTDLVANDAVGGRQIFVRDMQLGTTTLVSVNYAGTDGGTQAFQYTGGANDFEGSYLPVISADGSTVVFYSYATDLLASATPKDSEQLFARNRQTATTNLVGMTLDDTVDAGFYQVALSANGRYVAFTSLATNLVSTPLGTPHGDPLNVYVRDLQTGATTLVDVNTAGTAGGNAGAAGPLLSADGRYVLFYSTATNLVSQAASGVNLYLRDTQLGTTTLVTLNEAEAGDGGTLDSQEEGLGTTPYALSADGSVVTFASTASDLVPNDNNNATDVFQGSPGPQTTILVSAAYTPPNPGALNVTAKAIHATEGRSFTAVVASFTDSDGDPAGNYTAEINWGDGGTSTGTITATAAGFNVTATHTFVEAGFYAIEITVSDADGSAAGASSTTVDTSPTGDITYPVEFDTSALKGTTGTLAFQFNPGAIPNAQPAVASISNLTVSGGSLTSTVTNVGNVSGALAGTAQLSNGSVLNEIEQGITFGTSVRFDVTISGAAVEQPSTGDFGSTFAVQLLATDGMTPQATIDPSGAVNTVDVNPNGGTRVTNFASSAQGGPPVAGTPNVADVPLSATGATLQATAGTAFTALIATFTDANADAQLSDFASPTIAWGDGQTSVGSITLGNNATFDVIGTHTYAAGGTFTASVTIDDLGGSAATAATSIVAGTIGVPPVNVGITNNDGVISVAAGTSTTYTIAVTNDGANTASNIAVSDPLPAQVTSAAWTGDTHTNITGALSDTIASLAPGASATYTMTVQVDPAATGSLVDTATVTVANNTSADTTARDTDAIVPKTNVGVTNNDGVTSVAAGSSTTYTIVVTNDGANTASNIAVGDPLPAQATSATWTGDTHTNIAGPLSDTIASLAPGSSITYTMTVQVDPAATGSLVNTATVTVTGNTSADTAATDTDVIVNGTVGAFNATVAAVSGYEYSPLTNATIATFTFGDGSTSAGPGSSTQFSASVHWGDGATSVGGVTQSGTTYTVAASHTYADEHVYPISVAISGAGHSVNVSTQATILEELLPDGTRGTANQRYVMEIYRDVLDRVADQGGLDYWTAKLNAGESHGQLAYEIVQLALPREEQRDLVQSLYQTYLHRAPDAGGLEHWTAFLYDGGTDEQLAQILVSSPEYLQKHGGGTNDGFLESLYHDALGRAVDASGRAFFDAAMAKGATPASVAAVIFSSDEYRRDLVSGFYEAFLDRPVDPQGLDAFVRQLAGGQRDEQIVAEMVSTDEFFAKTAQ